jgi:mRNA-degrading endonuclease RelE of RelBE toxin-antitoxin system
MELKYKGSFKRDFAKCSRANAELVYECVVNIRKATSEKQIQNLKKLRKYSTHYRIKIGEDYRLGIIVRKKKVFLVRFGHRNSFYDSFPG